MAVRFSGTRPSTHNTQKGRGWGGGWNRYHFGENRRKARPPTDLEGGQESRLRRQADRQAQAGVGRPGGGLADRQVDRQTGWQVGR